jgi:hypothetical protein
MLHASSPAFGDPKRGAPGIIVDRSAMVPAVPAFSAAPTEAVPMAIPAPVPAGTVPAVGVPAMPTSAVNELHLINHCKAIGRCTHAGRRDRRICAAGYRQETADCNSGGQRDF